MGFIAALPELLAGAGAAEAGGVAAAGGEAAAASRVGEFAKGAAANGTSGSDKNASKRESFEDWSPGAGSY